MTLNYLLPKLILTPLIIAAATLAARRWGENIGGLIVGLPLMSGPISVYFSLEQGPTFASNAAKGTLVGLIPVAVFCSATVLSAKKFSCLVSTTISILLYFLSVWAISFVVTGFPWSALLVILAVVLALKLTSGLPPQKQRFLPPWWDIPVRMAAATLILLLITTLANALGPKWTGLLSPFPIITFVMTVFLHNQVGPEAASRLARGVLLGLFACTAFYLIIALWVEHTSLITVYSLATLAALLVNALSLFIILWKNHSNSFDLSHNSTD